jgi:DNA-directed RNA polymerase alpha subunit
MGLSQRASNSMRNVQAETFGDLVRLTPRVFGKIKGFGKISLKEIVDLLESENMKFGMRYKIDGEKMYVFDWGMPPDVAAASASVDEEEGPENETP